MATYSDTFSGRPAVTLYLDVTESSTNSGANTSVVSWTLRVVGNSASWNNGLGPWSVTVNGVNWSGDWNYDFRSDNTPTIATGSTTVTHLANGSKTISSSASASDSGGSPLGTASVSGSLALTDFSVLPSAPATAPTITRSSDGATITLVSAVASSAVTLTKYEYRWSTNNSTWTTVTPLNTTTITSRTSSPAFTGTTTQVYYFQTRGVSSEGNGAWSPTATSPGVPSAPSSITTTRTARDVTVTVGAPTTNGGSAVTGYFVQYSTNAGSTWSTAQAMTAQSYTYTGLTAGLTYRFRTYATNVTGNSAYTTAPDLFVPAGGKRYDGSAWNSTATAKRFDGSAWVDLTTAKRFDGSTWIDLS